MFFNASLKNFQDSLKKKTQEEFILTFNCKEPLREKCRTKSSPVLWASKHPLPQTVSMEVTKYQRTHFSFSTGAHL